MTRIGFKPMTACLEGRSSIQLSYRVIPAGDGKVPSSETAAKLKKKQQETKLGMIFPSLPARPQYM